MIGASGCIAAAHDALPRLPTPANVLGALTPLTEEQREIQTVAREFARDRDRAVTPTRGIATRTSSRHRAASSASSGFSACCIPEEYDGLGLDTLTYLVALEEIADRRRVGRGDDERAQLAADADAAQLRDRRAERALPQADGARRDARRVRAVASRRPDPTPRRCARRPCATATTGFSTAPRAGSRAARTPTSSSPWRAPTPPTTGAGARGISAFIVTPDLPGLQRRQEGRQDGPARVADGAAPLRRHARSRREPARRRGAGASSTRCSRSTTAGSASPRRRSASREAALRARARLRGGAQAVRQADQGIPGDPVQARRHGDARRVVARAAARRGRREGPRRAHHAVQLDGQAARRARRRCGSRRRRFRSSAATAT